MADPILTLSHQVWTKLNKLTSKYQATLSRLAISPNEGWLFYITSCNVAVAFVCQYEVSPMVPIIAVDVLNYEIQYVFHIIADWEKDESYLICHADKIEDRICDLLNITDSSLVKYNQSVSPNNGDDNILDYHNPRTKPIPQYSWKINHVSCLRIHILLKIELH